MSDREVSFVNLIRQGEEIPTHIDSNSLTTGFFFFLNIPQVLTLLVA